MHIVCSISPKMYKMECLLNLQHRNSIIPFIYAVNCINMSSHGICLINNSYFVLNLFWNNDRWLQHGLQFNIATLGLLTTTGENVRSLNLYNQFFIWLSHSLSAILIIQYFNKSSHTFGVLIKITA